MAIIPSIINWLNIKRINQIELFKKYPFETQQETLYQLLAKAASTEWGKIQLLIHYINKGISIEVSGSDL